MAISCMDNSGTGGLGAHSVLNGTAKRKEKKKNELICASLQRALLPGWLVLLLGWPSG